MRRVMIPVRQGPGLAEARAAARRLPRMVDAVEVDVGPAVYVSTRDRAAVPDGAMPAGLPALRDAFAVAGWVWEVGYSRAQVPAVRYVKTGAVRRAARDVDVVTLRVRCPWARAYGAWTDRRWSGGAVVSSRDGWRKLSTAEAFRSLIDA